MNVTIFPGTLHGDIAIPPSKSMGHRLLIAAHLAGAPESVLVDTSAEDLAATEACLGNLSDDVPALDCRESAATFRFLLPMACALKERVIVLRKGTLRRRSMDPLFDVLTKGGTTVHPLPTESAAWTQEGDASAFACNPSVDMPLVIQTEGRFSGGDFTVPGNESSQYATGLLFALALSERGGSLTLTKPIVSRPYLHMTLSVLKQFHILIRQREDDRTLTLTVPGGQFFTAPTGKPLTVEGDWSAAAFFVGANTLGSHVHITGLPKKRLWQKNLQADSVIEEMAAAFQVADPKETLTFSVADCPDLLPILCVMAYGTGQGLVLTDTKRLQNKESDRIGAMAQNLRILGREITIEEDAFVMAPGMLRAADDSAVRFPVAGHRQRKEPLSVQGHHDHRIVMAMAIAATVCDRPITISDASAVRKSYPAFWDDFAKAGGKVEWRRA